MDTDKKLSAEELAELRRQLKRELAGEIEDRPKSDDTDDESSPLFVESKVVTVSIAEDQMSASVTLSVPLGNELYNVPEIIRELRANKVVLGIQSQVIMEMVNLGQYETETVVAVGKEVVPGVEGYYEFLVDMEEHKTPEIREDGTVDYTAVGKLTNVAEGDKIAIYHPAVQGTRGFTVCGAELLPKFAKDLPVLRGKFISHNEEFEYFATRDGRISYSNYNVEILDVYEINEDITLNFGKVEFYGDIIINGNVETGSSIRAGRNITINGTVANARISAGGDITLTRGIQGNGQGRVTTRGNVFAEFIEYAVVEAAGDVFSNYILESNVSAGGKLIADGNRGSVIGGTVHGLLGVEIKNAGTKIEQRTVIHAGFKQEDYHRFSELSKQENAINNNLANLVGELSDLLKIARERGLNGSQKEEVARLNEKKDEAYAELDSISLKKKELGEKMAKSAGAAIVVKGEVNCNTVITIDAAATIIGKTETYLKYLCRNDEIVRRTI
ncbi:MAG: DUF342 domain-containing protein [Lachnospiraceae bacterium]|nr:DUF342 domain-containing protein [Candidatus Colinaster scatohippi]